LFADELKHRWLQSGVADDYRRPVDGVPGDHAARPSILYNYLLDPGLMLDLAAAFLDDLSDIESISLK
jgi:hypothetical protein